MEIYGFDGRKDVKDSRERDLAAADDPRAIGLAVKGDDVGDQDGEDVGEANPLRRADGLTVGPVNSLADLGALVVAQFVVLSDDMDRKHQHLARKMLTELSAARQEMAKQTIPEERDEGIREHMRVIQSQITNMHQNSISRIEGAMPESW
jgi:hypothetical protein